ncbi:MAG: hypothetical protein KGN80_11605 [Acidobacteriota bacterium]|nr:hypothetical protein [Acidobacteriota bacterium]
MFDQRLVGHRAIREKLLSRIQLGKLAGSVIFAGPEGIGKRRIALELAQRELCFKGTACGACQGCKAFWTDPLPKELPNLLRIAPEGKAGIIKVGVVRDSDLVEGGVIAWASMAPPPRCHRWILIEDAHRLHGAAANMLLKTLEEPPPGTHLVLITHRPEAMLQTIRSRCERIAFAPLLPEEAWAVASAHGWLDAEREAWTALSAGSLRFLEREAFERAAAQVDAWLRLSSGASYREAAGPLIPDRNADLAVSEQLRQPLELLLALLNDAARVRGGGEPSLAPWRAGIAQLAGSPVDLKLPQDLVYQALRHLPRNPAPEPVLRELGMVLR